MNLANFLAIMDECDSNTERIYLKYVRQSIETACYRTRYQKKRKGDIQQSHYKRRFLSPNMHCYIIMYMCVIEK